MADSGIKGAHKALFRRIRILRKKLQQIECLRLLSRDLNEEELDKVSREDNYRDELSDLLIKQSQLEETQEDDENICEHITTQENAETEVAIIADAMEDINISEKQDQQFFNEKMDESSTAVTQTAPHRNVEKETQREIPKPSVKESQKPTQDVKESQKPKPDVKRSQKPVEKFDPLIELRSLWSKKYFDLTELTGHSDIILAVDVCQQYVLSASRDTTVKLWGTSTCDLLRTLSGHTGAVNCVKFISRAIGDSNEHHLAVSGSEDCSIRLWGLDSGKQIEELYVYNSVYCLLYLEKRNLLLAGLDGGKLECIQVSPNLKSRFTHSVEADNLCTLATDGTLVAAGGSDGAVFVFEVNDSGVRCLFTLESELSCSIKSLVLHNDAIIIGDCEANMKCVKWKRNEFGSLANHHSEFGVTDGLALSPDGKYLLSSAYDYDKGSGYLNVRDASTGSYEYLTSIGDPALSHILSVSVSSSQTQSQGDDDSSITIVTGGIQLVVWKEVSNKSEDIVKTQFRKLILAEKEEPSESEDYDANESDDSMSEADMDVDDDRKRQDNAGGWFWCNLL